MVLDAVDVPGDQVRLPLDGERVELLVDPLAEVVDAAEAAATVVAGAVDRAEDLVGEPADVLHDVDLAGAGPRVVGDVGAEAPERRPEAVAAGRHPQPRLDPPVGELGLVLREQAGRLVLARPVVALAAGIGLVEGDHEVAVAVGGAVVGVVGVVLQLLVAPPVLAVGRGVTDLVGPVRRVRRCAGGAVELVAPRQTPAGRTGIGRPIVLQRDGDVFAATGALEPEVEALGAGPVLTESEVVAHRTQAHSVLVADGQDRPRPCLFVGCDRPAGPAVLELTRRRCPWRVEPT